jgi:hypothetical protein
VTTPEPLYDRQLLLAGAKRNEVLGLWEVQRYGTDSYADPDYVSIYGMRPAEWYAKGVRLLGRTVVECTRDALARAIAEDVAAIAQTAPPSGGPWIVDPFAGSANTLFWLLHHLPAATGLGCELDQNMFQLTTHNLNAIAAPIEIVNTDYRTGIASASVPADQLVIAFIAPPWGDALNPHTGLDLRRTTPPISEIVDCLFHTFSQHKLLCAIQVYEKVDQFSLAELTPRFDWSNLRMYDLNKPGQNHGILLATRGWSPKP